MATKAASPAVPLPDSVSASSPRTLSPIVPLAASTTPPSTSQPIASTSAVKLDEHVLSNPTSLTTSDTSLKVTPEPQSLSIKEEDEDARLLASLANGLSAADFTQADQSNGHKTFNEVDSKRLLATMVSEASSSTKAENKSETFNAFNLPNEGDFSGAASAEMEDDPNGPIEAYAKLEFPGFSYYLKTLSCTIGRRPAHMRRPALPEGGIIGAKKMEGDVDVDLGFLKSISRIHVIIFYQDQPRTSSQHGSSVPDMFGQRPLTSEASGNQGRFVLQVLGRNGAFVDDVLVLRDDIVPLGKRTKIQIAERVFYFVLPPTPLAQKYNSDGELDSTESLGESDEEEDSESLGSSESEEEEGESGLSSIDEDESGLDEEEEEEMKEAESKRRPKLVLKKKPVPPSKGGKGKGKGKHQGKTIWAGKGKLPSKQIKEDEEEDEEDGEEEEDDDEDEEMAEAEDDGSQRKGGKGKKIGSTKKEAKGKLSANANASATSRKRKRGEPGDGEPQGALKVGTPIGVEALKLKPRKKKKAVAAEEGDSEQTATSMSASSSQAKGKGKGGGKAHVVAAAMAAKAKADEEKAKNDGSPAASSIDRPAGTAEARPIAASTARPVGQPTGTKVTATGARPVVAPSTSNSQPTQINATTTPAQRPLAPGQPGSIQASPRPFANAAGSPPAAFPPSAAAFAHLTNVKPSTATGQQPLPPAGAGIKPDLSNMELIKNALANSTSVSRDGKLTLQEIYEDITGKYEWYRNNNRANGRDWHSSIRHAVGSSREMCRIPRKGHEQGKGIFYALNSSEAARLYRLDLENSGNGLMPTVSSTTATPVTASLTSNPVAATSAPTYTPTPAMSASVTPALGANGAPLASAVHPTAPTVASPAKPQMVAAPSPPARPSPPIQPGGRVTIVIGRAPPEALALMAAVPKAAVTQSIESLFGGPPIVHHEGKLYLSPVVFGHMSASEISEIGGKGAAQALALLQSQLVKHLQSKMNAGRGGTTAAPARPPSAASSHPSTQGAARPAFTTAGAPPFMTRPRPPLASGGGALPQVGRPSGLPPGSQSMRPDQNRPAIGAPMTGAQPARPLHTPYQPSQGRPVPNTNATAPQHSGVRPTGAPMQSRPPHGTPLMTQNRPPLTAGRPQQQQQQHSQRPVPPTNHGAPLASFRPTNSAALPSSHPSARPATSAPARPSSQVLPVPSQASAAPRPSPQTLSGAVRPAPVSTAGSIVTNASAAPVTSSSSAMVSAMQALDAAGLMPLLSGGKLENGTKLTPSQLELLQRVGRIAEEQQRAQQQRRDQLQASTDISNKGSSSSSSASPAITTAKQATQPNNTPPPSTPMANK